MRESVYRDSATMGRIDVHAHLLPAVDDGSRSVGESIEIAQRMVQAGYTHLFCTPHVWPHLSNTVDTIPGRVRDLQILLDGHGIPLKLLPGGELHLSPDLATLPAEKIVTYNLLGRYAIFDFWTDTLPPYFDACVKNLQSQGIQPILAHPERIEAIQSKPSVVDRFAEQGLLLQCNLECLGEPKMTVRRILAERWLAEGRYFMIGSDLHRIDTLDRRLNGLARAAELVGQAVVDRLTIENPSQLLG